MAAQRQVQVVDNFPDGGTLTVDNDTVNVTAIKVQKNTIRAQIIPVRAKLPLTTPPQIRLEVYFMLYAFVDDLPDSWQRLVGEVGRVNITAGSETRLLHDHVIISYDPISKMLRLKANRYQ